MTLSLIKHKDLLISVLTGCYTSDILYFCSRCKKIIVKTIEAHITDKELKEIYKEEDMKNE